MRRRRREARWRRQQRDAAAKKQEHGASDPALAPILIQLLKTDDEDLQLNAAAQAARFGAAAAATRATLEELRSAPSEPVRAAVEKAITAIDAAGRPR